MLRKLSMTAYSDRLNAGPRLPRATLIRECRAKAMRAASTSGFFGEKAQRRHGSRAAVGPGVQG